MSKICCFIISLFGFSMVIYAIVLFVGASQQLANFTPVLEVPLTLGEETTTELVKVKCNKLCRVGIRSSIWTDRKTRKLGDESRTIWHYHFPVEYSVKDGQGTIIQQQDEIRIGNHGTKTSYDGPLHERHLAQADIKFVQWFNYFEPPIDSKLAVTIKVSPDTIYEAKANELVLVVRDDGESQVGNVTSGVFICVIGAFLTIGGFALGIYLIVREDKWKLL